MNAGLFRLEEVSYRSLYHLLRLRPIDPLFISGDAFRALASLKIDGEKQLDTFQLSDATLGRLVFINGWLMPRFIQKMQSREVNFHLITHNSDWGPDEHAGEWWDKVSSKEFHWFAQNCTIVHPRIHPIPIGLENRRLHCHGIVRDFRQLRKKLNQGKINKIPRILYGFAIENYPQERRPAFEILQKHPLADTFPRMNSRDYRGLLSQYQFVAAPRGNGLDTHRVWEAFYLRTVPIVLPNRLTKEWPNLPWLVLNSWDEVQDLTPSFLTEFYTQIPKNRWQAPELFMPYWVKRIQTSC